MAEFKILSKNDVNYIEIIMEDDTVTVESGAMHYILGDISMESGLPDVKAKLSGERMFRPKYKGTGLLVLEPSLTDFYQIILDDEAIIIDRGAYLASDQGVEISIKVNRAISGALSGEGFVQTMAKGTGTVIIKAPGPIEKIQLNNQKLVVDGSFVVARSGNEELKFDVRTSTKSLIGSITSGEGLVNVLEGTGIVYIAPVPSKNIILEEIIQHSLKKYQTENSKPIQNAAKTGLSGCLVNLLTIPIFLVIIYFIFLYIHRH